MIRFHYQFPVYDRTCGQNVFDWIMVKAQEVRSNRKLVRNFQYQSMILSKEQNGKLPEEASQKPGKTKASKAKASTSA